MGEQRGDGRAAVVYFAIPDESYPRNSRIREYLERDFGATVVIPDHGVDHRGLRGKLRRFAALVRGSRGASAIVLAEFGTKYTLPARALATWRRVPLVVDGFVGMYETHIEDWQTHGVRSPHALMYRVIDGVALRFASIYLVDTRLRADRIRSSHRKPPPVLSLPVGAPAWAAGIDAEKRAAGALRLLYYGNFIPLHGLDTVVTALADPRLRGRVTATFLGDGGLLEAVRRDVERAGLMDMVRFAPPVPPDELADAIACHDVVLGIFGNSTKAGSVIANKVWQGLAAGRTVITRRSEALAEISGIAPDQLRTVPPADPQALADEILALVGVAEGATSPRFDRTANVLEQYVHAEFEQFGAELRRQLRR